MKMEEPPENRVTRRDVFRYAGLAGVVGFAGFAGLQAGSKPAIAAPTGTPTIASGITEGTHPVSAFDIEYRGLDTSQPITITYVFVLADGTESTDTHTIDLSGKEASGTVSTGAHNITVPAGDIQLGIEVSHPSLLNGFSTNMSPVTSVLSPPTIDTLSSTPAIPTGAAEGTQTLTTYDISYTNLDTGAPLDITYTPIIDGSAQSSLSESQSLSSNDGSVTAGGLELKVPQGTVSIQTEVTHPDVATPKTVESSATSVVQFASGGSSTTTYNGYRIHAFENTSGGTFSVGGSRNDMTVDVLVVGGGGGGGGEYSGYTAAGGGGGGGINFNQSVSVSPGNFGVTVGNGGSGGGNGNGNKGGTSAAFGFNGYGGGGGAIGTNGNNAPTYSNYGGGGGAPGDSGNSGASGTSQGNRGGDGQVNGGQSGSSDGVLAGGGGAGNQEGNSGGHGGNGGDYSSFFGTGFGQNGVFAGGGGGGKGGEGSYGGNGGTGGGGSSPNSGGRGGSGTNATGGGGGAGDGQEGQNGGSGGGAPHDNSSGSGRQPGTNSGVNRDEGNRGGSGVDRGYGGPFSGGGGGGARRRGRDASGGDPGDGGDGRDLSSIFGTRFGETGILPAEVVGQPQLTRTVVVEEAQTAGLVVVVTEQIATRVLETGGGTERVEVVVGATGGLLAALESFSSDTKFEADLLAKKI